MVYKNTCRYCNKEISVDNPHQFPGHVTNCKSHPRRETMFKERRLPRIKKRIICKICKKEFILYLRESEIINNKYKKHCSRACSNKRILSDETKKKISGSLLKLKRSKKRKKVICNYCKKEFEVLMSKKRKYCSKECFADYQQTDKFKEEHRRRTYKRRHPVIQSTPEVFMGKLLKANGIKYKKGTYVYGNPDFLIDKLCVFVDGEYWHNYPDLREIDLNVNNVLSKEGYEVLRFWVEKNFYKDPTKCIDKIKSKIGPS